MYQTVGGADGINQIVGLFYETLWSDPELQPYFSGIDRERLKHHQRQFLPFALGGGALAYEGRALGESHANLKITNEAFSKVQWYLRATLEELDINRPLIMIINGFVEGGRGQVVTATPHPLRPGMQNGTRGPRASRAVTHVASQRCARRRGRYVWRPNRSARMTAGPRSAR